MTWAEFQLRLFAFNRMQKREWEKIVELSTNVLIAGFIDGKEKKKRINQIRKAYLQEGTSNGMTEAMRKTILKAQQEYKSIK
tara:strand:+ start:461 stop:706 length:246 start_codon:yes stop_codon:yes gene_type:complete